VNWGGASVFLGLLALAATIGGWPGWGIVALLAWMLSRG
jgi:hypothetical protein